MAKRIKSTVAAVPVNSSTIDLRTSLRTKLLTLCSQVYYERAKDDTAGEYVVFTLTAGNYQETYIQYDFEVYVVGFGTDTTTVENLTDSIWGLFNHYSECEGSLSYVVYPVVRNNLTDENENMIHRRILFTVKSFIGGY